MKKIFTHIFVVLANYYIWSYFVGWFLMLSTILFGAFNPTNILIAGVGMLGISIAYQFLRHKLNFQSFGEQLISCSDKNQILNQKKMFSITRIPLFILILLTLVISGNIMDGLSEQRIYSVGSLFHFGFLTLSSYFGIKNLIRTDKVYPLILIVIMLYYTGFGYKNSANALLTGDFMFNLYHGLSITWVIVGIIYYKKRTKKDLV